MTETHSVLIVDDTEVDRYILKRKLKSTGLDLSVVEKEDGVKALEFLMQPLEKVQQDYPDIQSPITIFLDINMPNMDGWGLLEAMVNNGENIPLQPMVVLMYTSSNDPDEKKRAIEYDTVVGFMTKDNATVEALTDAIKSTKANLM